MYKIFLVEDDISLSQILAAYLKNEGWEVQTFADGNSAAQAIQSNPHLWILDIMLPDIDGYHLLRLIKDSYPAVPIIFISARDTDYDRVIGLEMGSDDYLAKPFLPQELVIRVKRLLERVYQLSDGHNLVELFPYILEEGRREARLGQERIDLTSKEYDLVQLFSRERGRALGRERIINEIWGEDFVGTDRLVDDLVRRLRKKMPELHIETIYGFGYRMTQ